MTRLSILLPPLAALTLSACFSFGAKPPPELLRLTPTASLPADTSRTVGSGEAITVVVPTVPDELATMRIPVRTDRSTVAYLKNAQWVEAPNSLFARLLSETIAASTGRVVLDPRQFVVDPGTRLTGQLQSFGLDSAAMQVVVVYDAVLADGGARLRTRRFEARVPVSEAEGSLVGSALNQAANQVAAEVARWIAG
jgi:cholesterol transport system auxiliary component